jgi:hypothetical protein
MTARALLATVAALLLSGCGGTSTAQGGCVGPEITLSSGQVAPGGELRVQARYVWADCYDTGQPGTPPPEQDVVIALEPRDVAGTFRLTEVDADADGRIDVTVRVPDDVPAGPATLRVGPGSTAIVVIVP